MTMTANEHRAIMDQLPTAGEKATLAQPLTAHLLMNPEDDDPLTLGAGVEVTVWEYGPAGPLGTFVMFDCFGEDYSADAAELLEAIGPDWRERKALADALNSPNQRRLQFAASQEAIQEERRRLRP